MQHIDWYVEPAFRSYAALLAAQALRHKTTTYLNISPAPNTRKTIEAQGYTRYSNGVFMAIPALQRAPDPAMRVVAAGDDALTIDLRAPAEPFERDLMARHAAYGCLTFWCVSAGRAYPFVFRRCLFKGVLPFAQLIYCRDVADIARFAGPLGRHLLLHGCAVVAIDANAPVRGLAGRYFAGWKPKYFKGPEPPRLGDLADTETALFGI